MKDVLQDLRTVPGTGIKLPKESKIHIAGHRGMVGSAIWRDLTHRGYANLIGSPRSKLDLLDQRAVRRFYAEEKPEYVFVAAAKVGGIKANAETPAEFLYENLQIECNLIHEAHVAGVKKLLFLGSSCIYPRLAPQPLREEYLLTAPLEPTNEWYAVAKIAGIKLCQAYRRQHGCDFISAMPTNLSMNRIPGGPSGSWWQCAFTRNLQRNHPLMNRCRWFRSPPKHTGERCVPARTCRLSRSRSHRQTDRLPLSAAPSRGPRDTDRSSR